MVFNFSKTFIYKDIYNKSFVVESDFSRLSTKYKQMSYMLDSYANPSFDSPIQWIKKIMNKDERYKDYQETSNKYKELSNELTKCHNKYMKTNTESEKCIELLDNKLPLSYIL